MADSDTPATTHRLPGFEPDNLLAILALLGLLRALDTARPDWRARAHWDLSREPLRPALSLREPSERVAVAEAATKGVRVWGRRIVEVCEAARAFSDEPSAASVSRMTYLTSAVEVTRNLAKQLSSKPDLALVADALACEAVDLRARNSEWRAGVTPLKLGSGQMAFAGTLSTLTTAPKTCEIRASLFDDWRYDRSGDTLRFAPNEAKWYALQAQNPGPLGASSEGGATTLAALGLLSFPTWFDGVRVVVPGQQRVSRSSRFRIPVWKVPTSLRQIETLIATGIGTHEVAGVVEFRKYPTDPNRPAGYMSMTRGEWLRENT